VKSEGYATLFHRDDSPVHKIVIAMTATNNSNYTVIEHPPYSPTDSSLHKFLSHSKLTTAISGIHFQLDDDVTNAYGGRTIKKDSFKSGSEVLKRITLKTNTI
jgi:hypothetical protein